jgi:MIP family channel proteins
MATPKLALRVDKLSITATLRAAFAEFLATGLYVFIGVGSIATAVLTGAIPDMAPVAVVIIAMAHGVAFALLVAGAGPISGGHVNPAITLALLVTRQLGVMRAAAYVAAQMLGAVAGMLLLRAVLADDLIHALPGAGGHTVSEGPVPGNLAAMGIEAVITFMLVWTVFATAVNGRGLGALSALYIGLAVMAGQLLAIPLTGAGANPARSFGPELINGRWDDAWVYYAGPLLGAALAAVTYAALCLTPGRREASANVGEPARSPESLTS